MSKHSRLFLQRQDTQRVRRAMRGITLIELMIVVVIVAILAGIAIPNYRAYTLRAQRTDATSALLRVGSAQEKFYLQNNTYTSNLTLLGIAGTERGYYTLSILNANASTFTAQATAPTTSSQYADGGCRTFTINETGQRTATSSSSTVTTEACWR